MWFFLDCNLFKPFLGFFGPFYVIVSFFMYFFHNIFRFNTPILIEIGSAFGSSGFSSSASGSSSANKHSKRPKMIKNEKNLLIFLLIDSFAYSIL